MTLKKKVKTSKIKNSIEKIEEEVLIEEVKTKIAIPKRDSYYDDEFHTQYLTKDKEYILTNDNGD